MKNHHVQIIEPDIAERIRAQLEADGFSMGIAPYALYEAVGTDVRATYYGKRKKFLIQGPGTDGLVLRLRELLGAESDAAAEDPDAQVKEPTIGSDESGKGDYFGSLVVAGCLVRPEDVVWLRETGIRDSKLASDVAIAMAEGIILNRLETAVVEHEPEEYGRLHRECKNVNVILGRMHAEVIRRLSCRAKGCRRVLVDRFGSEEYVLRALGEDGTGLRVRQIPRAEKNPAVAAASFLARAQFVRSLARLSDRVGVDLIPGASAEVENVARKVFAVGGEPLLAQVAKMHFKTTERIVPGRIDP